MDLLNRYVHVGIVHSSTNNNIKLFIDGAKVLESETYISNDLVINSG